MLIFKSLLYLGQIIELGFTSFQIIYLFIFVLSFMALLHFWGKNNNKSIESKNKES